MCDDGRNRTHPNAVRHEHTAFHQTLVDEDLNRLRHESEASIPPGEQPEASGSVDMPMNLRLIDDATRNLLQSFYGTSTHEDASTAETEHNSALQHPDLLPIEGWGIFEANEDTDLAMSLEQQGAALIARSLMDRLDELSDDGSVDRDAERSQVDEDEVPEPMVGK